MANPFIMSSSGNDVTMTTSEPEVLRRTLPGIPQEVAALKEEGKEAFGRREYAKALEAYDKALRALPEGHGDVPLLHSNKGACNMMLKKRVPGALLRQACGGELVVIAYLALQLAHAGA